MINFKKGPALSLHQVNYIGSAKTGEGVKAGMIVRINEDGQVVRGTDDDTEKGYLYGFAINSQDAGDVIESGKIGVYALDGASVIETDQFIDQTYDVGALVTVHEAEAPSEDAGKITLVTNPATQRVIGQVEAGVHVIPGVTQTINGYKVQGSVSVVSVKLFS